MTGGCGGEERLSIARDVPARRGVERDDATSDLEIIQPLDDAFVKTSLARLRRWKSHGDIFVS
jgi:hypothetical protein